MKIPREAQRIARKLFQICLERDGSLNSDTLKKIIAKILDERPRFTVGILQRLHELCRLHLAQSTAKVTSAHPLGSFETEIRQRLHSVFHHIREIQFHTDPSLLGGLKIQIGSHVWDSSIRQKLKTLEESLAQSI